MARSGVRDVDHGWKKLMQVLAQAKSGETYVKVGVIGTAAQSAHEGISNVELAAVHEFGSPDRGIPERSFIRSTYDEKRDAWTALLKKALRGVYEGKVSLEQALSMVGLRAEADIKRHVTSGVGIPPPLKPATIARKGSSRPLVDTGRMINSVSHEVVTNGAAGPGVDTSEAIAG